MCRLQHVFALCLTALVLLACTPDDWEVVRGSLSPDPPEEVVMGETVEKVYNCGRGGDVIYMTPQIVLASTESVQWEVGVELEGGVGVGATLLARLNGELGAELQAKYGKSYEISRQVGTGWQLPARPGEWIAYTIRWSEIWEPGTILVTDGREQKPVKYRYRKAIKTDIVDKELLDCGDEAASAAPTVEPVATATPAVVEPQTDVQVTIRGVGFPPADMTNPAQRRQAALLAAEMDAKRNLAVWLAGEDIETVTIVENNQVASDEIRRKVNAYLKGVRVLSQAYDESTGQATVEIAPVVEGMGNP